MAIRTELSLRLQNSPGALSRVCQVLANERVNLVALSLDGSGTLRMVVDNPIHAAATLREQHYQVDEREVLYTIMPNQPGSLAKAVKLVADAGVNLDYAYATGVENDRMVGVVIGVPDTLRASAAAGI
ncbi:MAG TPA: ACT domain-containing protein [Vicinamibacterales bacterium]|jgi:hypothetical protein